ncbi:MAG: IPT/TIG domain-containing protein, partial [Planctomycetaceae bacterium]|nr:IPT/TIG domain-containing protein [Planctomycetaceae bacterium]
SGPAAGGTSVTITGTNLSGATEVLFGTAAATNLHVVNDNSITATSPAGTGTVDVTVTTPSGTSTISPNDKFTYT